MDLEQLTTAAARRNLEVKSADPEELRRALRANDVARETLEEDSRQQQVENRKATLPASVTKEEREKHERTHLPYRSWCEICGRTLRAAAAIRDGCKSRRSAPPKPCHLRC